jgi:hypothetical protein
VQHQGKLTGERAATKAGLVDLLQGKSALEAHRATSKERAEHQPFAFARASQNVAVAAALLDILAAPSMDRVGEVCQ